MVKRDTSKMNLFASAHRRVSLRDSFAISAAANPAIVYPSGLITIQAELAYRIADQMMLARQKAAKNQFNEASEEIIKVSGEITALMAEECDPNGVKKVGQGIARLIGLYDEREQAKVVLGSPGLAAEAILAISEDPEDPKEAAKQLAAFLDTLK